jgi:hypothetical protein
MCHENGLLLMTANDCSRAAPISPLLRREMFDTTPPFSRDISCPVLIPGESGDSRLSLGFDERGEIAVISAIRERFEGEFFGPS